MNELTPSSRNSLFEAIKGEDGRWSARDLQGPMGYASWQAFKAPLERAMISAHNQGMEVDEVFRVAPENPSELGGRPREDYRLTRHGAYLLAMNGDPRKPQCAAAQSYFAIRTQQAEQAMAAPTGGLTPLEVMRQQLDVLIQQEQRVTAIEMTQAIVEAKIESLEGKFDEFACLGYAKKNGYPTGRPYLARVGRRATALMRATGQIPHTRDDATFGEINIYPVDILDQAFSEVPFG